MDFGLVAIGIFLIGLPLALRISALRIAKRNHRVIARPRAWTLRSPMMWAGVVVGTIGINQTAGTIAFAIGTVALLALIVRALIKAPGSIRRSWRHIGDPDSWRGTSSDRADR